MDTLYISGLALDFCVFFTAMDGIHLGYKTFVIQDATRGITQEGINEALEQMKQNGVQIIQSKDPLPTSSSESCSPNLLLLLLVIFKIN